MDMTITEKHVNESHIDEVARLIQNEKMMINLDRNDVKVILLGKEGMLYQAIQEEDVDHCTFMREFFGELMKKEYVKTCTSLMLSIGMSSEDPLMMDDMLIVQDFFDSFDSESIEMKWGLKNSPAGSRMTLLAICAKDK